MGTDVLPSRDTDVTPRVLITTDVDGDTISVVEPCMVGADGIVERRYLWQAVTGTFELRDARFEDGRRIPGGAYGDGMELIATSTTSAAAALSNARRAYARRRL